MFKITKAHLVSLVKRINELTGTPPVAFKKTIEGYKACVDNYHLSEAYGGFALHKVCNEGGGVEGVFCSGHIPKREMYGQLRAFIKGLEYAAK